MEIPRDESSIDPLDDPDEGPALIEANIRNAEEDRYRKYRSLDREHVRLGTAAIVFVLLATVAFVISIVTSIRHGNQETAFLAAGAILWLLFFIATRACDYVYKLKKDLPHPPKDHNAP